MVVDERVDDFFIEYSTTYVSWSQRKKRVDFLFIESSFCRFSCRGVDDDGHVANFVETEQLIQIGEHTEKKEISVHGTAIQIAAKGCDGILVVINVE
jgi:hypothetical protein